MIYLLVFFIINSFSMQISSLQDLNAAQSILKRFEKKKFFPWTDEQKNLMMLLAAQGTNPDRMLFHLFSFGFDEQKNQILLTKVHFLRNVLKVDINELCDKENIIPIRYAKKIIDKQTELNLSYIIRTFRTCGGNLSLSNLKQRNLLYYIVKCWQLSWDIEFLQTLIEEYKIPVISDSENNTLIHAMAKSPFFFFKKEENFESSHDFKRKWNVLTTVSQFISFIECNQRNAQNQFPYEITLNKYGALLDCNTQLSHIVLYAYEKYFQKT